MTEEYASPDKPVRLLFSELGNLGLHLLSHGEASKFDEKFFVVNTLIGGCLNLKSRNKIFFFDLLFLAVFFLCLS
jgi:hypothetical protein